MRHVGGWGWPAQHADVVSTFLRILPWVGPQLHTGAEQVSVDQPTGLCIVMLHLRRILPSATVDQPTRVGAVMLHLRRILPSATVDQPTTPTCHSLVPGLSGFMRNAFAAALQFLIALAATLKQRFATVSTLSPLRQWCGSCTRSGMRLGCSSGSASGESQRCLHLNISNVVSASGTTGRSDMQRMPTVAAVDGGDAARQSQRLGRDAGIQP